MSASCLADQKRKLKAGVGLKLLKHLQIHSILIGRQTNNQGRTLLNYNFSLHNPDLFKSVRYNVLLLFMIPAVENMPSKTATINFAPVGNGIRQGPRNTSVLLNHSLNYADPTVGWYPKDLMSLKAGQSTMILWCVMEVEYLAFDRVISKHQITRRASIYFDNNGSAFIDPHFGLKLTGKLDI